VSYLYSPENDNVANRASDEWLEDCEFRRAEARLAEAKKVSQLNENLSDPERAKANLASYAAMLAAALPTAMWDYELKVTTGVRASAYATRIEVREATTNHIIMFCEVYIHSFLGRPHTEFLAVLPMTVKGERRSSVIPTTERSVAEIARTCIEDSQLGLHRGLGTNEENERRLAFLGDRADYALTMLEWSDRPEANIDRYCRRLADELPAAVHSITPTLPPEIANQLSHGIAIKIMDNHVFEIRDATDDHRLFTLAVKIHQAYGSKKYLAVQVIDKNHQSGSMIDIRTKSPNELAIEIFTAGLPIDSPADDVDFR
jgi:hypothetical protein